MTGSPRPGAGTPLAAVIGWQDGAACKGDGHLFFGPDDETPQARDLRVARAKTLCSGCPARLACRELAVTLQAGFGIWAGEDLEGTPPAPLSEDAPALCTAGYHWMTPENSKLVAGSGRVRCRECQNISDRRTAAARRSRARDRAAEREEQVA